MSGPGEAQFAVSLIATVRVSSCSGMRCGDGGEVDSQGRVHREQMRRQAARMFANGMAAVQLTGALEVQQGRRTRGSGPGPLAVRRRWRRRALRDRSGAAVRNAGAAANRSVTGRTCRTRSAASGSSKSCASHRDRPPPHHRRYQHRPRHPTRQPPPTRPHHRSDQRLSENPITLPADPWSHDRGLCP